MEFISLHSHTCYSVLDGLSSVPELVARAKQLGMPGLGITDHGTMTGVFKFYKECRANGINPIIGEEFYVARHRMTDKTPADRERYHLTVLAKNNVGLHNLFKLSTLSYTEGFYYKPRIDEPTLFKYKEGLIVLSGCHSSRLSQLLVGDPEKDRTADPTAARELARQFQAEFGEDFYLELQTHGLVGLPKAWEEQVKLNRALIELGRELNIKCVLTADNHYLDPEDVPLHETLLAIGTNRDLDEDGRMSLEDFDLSFPDPTRLEPLLIANYGTTEYATNTLEINAKVDIQWEYGEHLLPRVNTGGISSLDYCRKLAFDGFQRKCPAKLQDQRYLDEVRYELEILNSMGFLDYFIIVQEYVNWAKKAGIGVGPSRGSACGSLLAYLMNITEIDPMDKGMLFERFINPERISVPDIDVDFEDQRRSEVLEHVKEVYGADHVCNILILNYMKSRAAFKDVARVNKLDFNRSNQISSLIEQSTMANKVTLQDSLNNVPELRTIVDSDPKIAEIFRVATELEGKPRQHGVHACGVLITPVPLVELIPLEVDKDGNLVSQFPPEDLEEIGLIKFDFLGLSTISVIANALRYIPELDSMYDIPQDDSATYDTFCRGESYFTFQFNTALSRQTCVAMQPHSVMELSDVTAMARPGPMANIPVYARRKRGEEKVTYHNKIEEKWFNRTYGVNCYQEQGMQYLREAADFTRGEADTWRKGVAKGKLNLLVPLKEKFLRNAPSRTGSSKAELEKWWDGIIEGGAYTFNLSHSYAYALLGYYTCYLLTHYPAQYLAAVMNNKSKDLPVLSECFEVAKNRGIRVLAPNVKESAAGFTPTADGNIVYGLTAIKGLGKTAEDIIETTRREQPQSLEEFLVLFDSRVLNRTKLVSLVKSGALDCFQFKRSVLLDNLDELTSWKEREINGRAGKLSRKQAELFANETHQLDLQPKHELDIARTLDILEMEKEVIGTYVTCHPIDLFRTNDKATLEDIRAEVPAGEEVRVPNIYGVITAVKKVRTKRGSNMAWLSLDCRDFELEVTVFARQLEEYNSKLGNGVKRLTVIKRNGKQGVAYVLDKLEDLREYV